MMAFSRLLGCGLLVHLAVALSQDAVTQPPSPAVRCQQLSPAPRPKGQVVLVCEVSGVRIKDVMAFYWWLNVTPTNIQTPIYTYSDVFDVDEITSTYRDRVVNETHVISQRHMTSEIKLLINMTTNGVFKFEITMASHQSYSEEVEISFDDPQITLNIEEMAKNSAHGSNSVTLAATCYVDACFSKPTMSISCNDIEGDNEILFDGQFDDRDPADHFSAIRSVVIKTRNCPQINCSVTDERGTYHATRNVTIFEDNIMPTPTASLSGCKDETMLIRYILLGVVVPISIMGATCVYVYIRRLRVNIDTRPNAHNPNEFQTESHYQPMITFPNGNLNPRGNVTSF